MSSIAIIPARGGSTRIPLKNCREFRGKPIITYSIETARRAEQFEQIIVSTDHDAIAHAAHEAGAFVLWRPANLCENDVGTQEVASSVIALFNGSMQYACCIYATAPLMVPADLQKGFALLKNNEAHHDFAMAVGAEPLRDAGQWYWGTAVAFKENRPLIGPRTIMVPIPEERVCDINTEEDWKRADQMYASRFASDGSIVA